MNDFRPLNEEEQLYLCKFIWCLVPVARTHNHPMRGLARQQIALTMWRWTADAVDTKENVVKQNAYKYNVKHHPATRNAFRLQRIGAMTSLRHEHAVPRIYLADRIIEGNLSEIEIHRLLVRCCRAVIVTKDEDKQLRPRNKMPDGWSPDVGNPYQRYVDCRLMSRLKNLPAEWRTA